MAEAEAPRSPRVGLFVTCLVDLFRPRIGFAAVRLLEQAGCRVEVPPIQTCCGQPAYNGGDRRDAAKIAAQVVEAFAGFDYLVAPSGSCAGMIRRHYPGLFAAETAMRARAEALAAKSWEIVSFLTDVMRLDRIEARLDGCAAYHDCCSGLRELGVKRQPRRLLGRVAGLELKELPGAEICCGFGGAFSVKYPTVSDALATDKLRELEASGAAHLLAGDLGCLMHLAGKLHRAGSKVRVRHVAEVLAGMGEDPAIGEPETVGRG
ncbi:MAG TPA: (Fe-S)-binding protein [Alphaproteobacteria bacterium]